MTSHPLRIVAAIVALTALSMSPSVHARAEEAPCTKEDSAPTRATPEAIRERAKTIQALKDMLKDADATIRLSALESMLSSCSPSLREVGYDAAFGSGDQALRALALKYKVLTMPQIIVELIPPENPTKDQDGLIKAFGLKHPVHVGQTDIATGTFSPQGNIIGTVNGLELRIQDYAMTTRMRLGEGAILIGTVSHGAVSVPAKIPLR